MPEWMTTEWLSRQQAKQAGRPTFDIKPVEVIAGQKHQRAPDAVEQEAELHEAIEAVCRRRMWGYIHSRMDRRATIGEGVCDFTILASGGRTILVECKSKRGKLSTAQLAFIAQAKRNGHTVHVIQSMAEFLQLL